jgi:hypothetical protein
LKNADICYLLSINTLATPKKFRIAKRYLYSPDKRKVAYFPSAFVPAAAGNGVAFSHKEALGLPGISPQFRPALYPSLFRVFY